MFTDLNEVGFEEFAHLVPVQELHLDVKAMEELKQKKEQVVNRQKA